jgi:hypothetical protein
MKPIGIFTALFAAACSGPAETVSAQPAVEKPITINWETLLPEGEIEEIDRLFNEYFAELDQKLQSQPSQNLFDAAEEDKYANVPEGSEFDLMPQIGTFNVVEELDGARVRIPGYVLPFEYVESGKISEFLLVPYFGACIHTPPPPPNQIVYVVAEAPVALGRQWDAIWAVGVLRARSNINELGDAAYTLEIESWETYDG